MKSPLTGIAAPISMSRTFASLPGQDLSAGPAAAASGEFPDGLETGQQAHLRDLRPDPENRRKHNPRNVGVIADAMQDVGFARSIVIDEHNVVLAGNASIDAAAEVGIERVRVIEASGHEIIAVRRRGLTDDQKRRLALADNRAAELATWDLDQLRADVDAGLDLSAFWSDTELADLLAEDAPVPHFEPEAPAHRLDQLENNVQCPACGHSWHQGAR